MPMSTGKISPISLLSALALVLTSTQAFAGASNKSGSPFGNGTFFGNDGTFSAVLRGKNMTGVTQFSTYSSGKITTGLNAITNAATADTAANVPGTVTVYLDGVSYAGIASGVLDPYAQTISAVFSSFSVRSATNFGVNQSLTNNTLANISTNSGTASSLTNSTNATSSLVNSLLSTNLATNANLTNYLVNTPTSIVVSSTTTNVPFTNPVSNPANWTIYTNQVSTNLYNQYYAFTNIGPNVVSVTTNGTNLVTNYTPFYTNSFVGVASNNTNNSTITNLTSNTNFSTNSIQTNNVNSLVISTNGNTISYTAGFSQSILGGAFTANFQNKYPNQTFSGDGSVTTPKAVVDGTNSSIVAETVSFSVNGVRVSSSSATYY